MAQPVPNDRQATTLLSPLTCTMGTIAPTMWLSSVGLYPQCLAHRRCSVNSVGIDRWVERRATGLSPQLGSALDAKVPACGDASNSLLIHHLWLGLGGVHWCPGHLYQPWGGWRSHTPSALCLLSYRCATGKVDGHSCYCSSALPFHLGLAGFLEVAGIFTNGLAGPCFCHPETL